MTHTPHKPPPAIILGGEVNALSVARALGRQGVRVYASGDEQSPVRHSRYARWLDVGGDGRAEDAWLDYLTSPRSNHLAGAVLLACSDAALVLVAEHRTELARKFKLDVCHPAAQLAMLDKLATYQIATEAGVPTPRFWQVGSLDDVQALAGDLVYPLLVKPRHSHLFWQRFGAKYLVAENFEQLLRAFDRTSAARLEAMLVEMIVGPDDLLCSYYTYLDEQGRPLFDFTKRIIRRYPASMGAACYHQTDVNPEVRELALALFRQAGLQGLANAEFKRDRRDGQLKLIECNARFTAANCLVASAGLDLAQLVYSRAIGRRLPPLAHYRAGLRLWYPIEDFEAFLELRRTSGMRFGQWLASICHRQTLPIFACDDPRPSLASLWRRITRRAGSSTRRLPAIADARESQQADYVPPANAACAPGR